MRETPSSTNVHCPTNPAEYVCWFDLDLGFPGDDQAGVKCNMKPVSVALLHSLLTLPLECGIATRNDECLRCTTFAPSCRDYPGPTEGETASDEWFFLSQTRAVAKKPWKWTNDRAGIAVWAAPRTQQTVACRYDDVTAAIRAQKICHDGCSNADVARPWLVACACSCLPHDVQPASAIKPERVDRKGN